MSDFEKENIIPVVNQVVSSPVDLGHELIGGTVRSSHEAAEEALADVQLATTSMSGAAAQSLTSNDQQKVFAAYSDCLTNLAAAVKRGESLRFQGPSKNSEGLVNAHDAIKMLEGEFIQTGVIKKSFVYEHRISGISHSVYQDLGDIHSRSTAIFSKLIHSFETPFGIQISNIINESKGLPKNWEEFHSKLDFANSVGARTVESTLRVGILTRLVKEDLTFGEIITEGQDYALESPFIQPSVAKLLVKDRRAMLEDQIAQIVLESVPESLASVLPKLSSFLVPGAQRFCSGHIYSWEAKVNLGWDSIESQDEFSAIMTPEIKRDILTSLYRVLISKGQLAEAFDLTFKQAIGKPSDFYISPARFVNCMNTIDRFCLNQVLLPWRETGEIPRSSFAMRVRRMSAYEVPAAGEGEEPKLHLKYVKNGELTVLAFSKGPAPMNSTAALPVCAWQLNTFLTRATERVSALTVQS